MKKESVEHNVFFTGCGWLGAGVLSLLVVFLTPPIVCNCPNIPVGGAVCNCPSTQVQLLYVGIIAMIVGTGILIARKRISSIIVEKASSMKRKQ